MLLHFLRLRIRDVEKGNPDLCRANPTLAVGSVHLTMDLVIDASGSGVTQLIVTLSQQSGQN